MALRIRDYLRSRREASSFQILITAILLIVPPVPMTDFFLSAAFCPIAYVVLYAFISGPFVLLLYWMVVPWSLLLFEAARLLDHRTRSRGRSRLVALLGTGSLLVSSLPIYLPPSHDSEDAVNLYILYSDEIESWWAELQRP